MQKIVFSKQCDHDLELMPLWLHWYTKVFGADKIIITPVKTKASEIVETTAFYEAHGIEVVPIELDTWQDKEIWERQREIVRPHLPESDFLVLSADTDQFFEPTDELPPMPQQVYVRINLIASECPTLDSLKDQTIDAHVSDHYIAGFANNFDNDNIFLTGHFHGSTLQLPNSVIKKEFHFAQRGFEQFLKKVTGTAVEQDGESLAVDWKTWRQTLDTGSEEDLHRDYDQWLDYIRLGEAVSLFADLFKAYALKEDTAPFNRPARSPIPSTLVTMHFPANDEAHLPVTTAVVPAIEVRLAEALLHGSRYRLPNLGRPQTVRVFDIGANLGFFSLYMKRRFPQAELHCFEPSPVNIRLLRYNLRHCPGVRIYPIALANGDGTARLHMDRATTLSHSLKQQPHFSGGALPVPVRSAAGIFDELHLGGLEILKISAEGAEPEILHNLGERLKSIAVICVDYRSEQARRQIDGILREFALCGASTNHVNRGALCYLNGRVLQATAQQATQQPTNPKA